MKRIIFLLVLFIGKTIEDGKNDKLEIHLSKDLFIYTKLGVGSSNFEVNGIISTGTGLTWVADADSEPNAHTFDDLYNTSSSDDYNATGTHVENVPEYSFSGTKATDQIYFHYNFVNESVKKFDIGVAKKSKYNGLLEPEPDVDAVIGFNKDSPYYKKLIKVADNKNVFSIELNESASSNLYFGNYSVPFLTDRLNTGFCFNREKDTINCRLSHIIFGENNEKSYLNDRKDVYKIAYFHTGINELIFPTTYREDIQKKLKNCEYNSGDFHFYCKDKSNVLSFVFNGYAVKISPDNFYKEESEGKYKLNIRFEGDKFYFGSLFFLEYKVLVDYDKGIIIFHNNGSQNKIGNVKYYTDDKDIIFEEFLVQYGIGVGLGLLFIGYTIYLIITKKKKVNKEN